MNVQPIILFPIVIALWAIAFAIRASTFEKSESAWTQAWRQSTAKQRLRTFVLLPIVVMVVVFAIFEGATRVSTAWHERNQYQKEVAPVVAFMSQLGCRDVYFASWRGAVLCFDLGAEGAFYSAALYEDAYSGEPIEHLVLDGPCRSELQGESEEVVLGGNDQGWIEQLFAGGPERIRPRDQGVRRPTDSLAAWVLRTNSPDLISQALQAGGRLVNTKDTSDLVYRYARSLELDAPCDIDWSLEREKRALRE